MRESAARPPGARARPVLAQWIAVAAAVFYSSFLMSYLLPAGRNVDFVSELERPGAPYAGWYRASDVVAGVLLLVVVRLSWPAQIRRTRVQQAVRWALVAAVVVAAGSIVDGASTMQCDAPAAGACDVGGDSVVGLLRQLLVGHTLSGLAGFLGAGLGATLCARAAWLRRSASWPRVDPTVGTMMRLNIVVAIVIGVCGLADLSLLLFDGDVNVVERVRIVAVSLWVAALPRTVQVCAPRRSGISDRYVLATARYGGTGHDGHIDK